jgi:DMSO reductase anchor subunit
MLLLTQCGVGSLAASWLAGDQVLAVCGAILAMAGGLAAALHLGRPWQAWRAWIGWRRSWLSREIILFGLHGPLALIYALGQHRVVGALTVATGVAGVFASGVLYHVTRREWWRGGRSVGRFLLTAALAGSAAAFLRGLAPGWVLALCGAIKCGAELHWLQVENPDLADEAHDPSRSREWMVARGVRLLDEHYGILNRSRFLCALLGGILLPLACQGLPAALTAVSLCAAAEIVERLLFFRAAVPAPMPGWNPANDP